MIELFLLYKWTIVAGLFTAMTLSVLGCWLAARDRAMQTLCMGQGATLGVLLGLGILTVLHSHDLAAAKPMMFLSAVGVSTLTFYLSERVVRFRPASQNTYFTFIFTVILALSYLVSALFPGLESHMSQYFFGDLATMSNEDSTTATILSGAMLCVFVVFIDRFSNVSFEESIFTREYAALHNRRWMPIFLILTLIYVSFAVQYVGFLFTAVCLFLPTSLINFSGKPGLRSHLMQCALLAGLSTVVGFTISLIYTHLPTVPTITAFGLVLGLVFIVISRLRLRLAA